MSDYQNKTTQFLNLGMNLRDAPDKLSPGQWRRLVNIRSNEEGSITARPGRQQVIPPTSPTGLVNTLFKLDQQIIRSVGGVIDRNGAAYSSTWWEGPKSYVRARSTEGEEKWAFVADPTNLRMIHADGTDYKWGITSPTLAATFGSSGTGPLNSSGAGTVYDWRFTWYNSRTGAESNPSPTAGGVACVNTNASITVQSSSDPQVDKIGIYRRGGVLTGTNTWRRVGLVLNGGIDPITNRPRGVVFVDNNSDSSISLAQEMKLDNDVPFTSVDSAGDVLREAPVPYIWGPFLGLFIFATGDPNRPGYVYWTNPSRPTSANLENKISVTSPDEPLMGGFVYNDLAYCFSRENFYALDYNGSGAAVTFSARKLPIGRGASGPWCVAGNGPSVYFLSKDNIYESDMQSYAKPITEDNIRPLLNPNAVTVASLIEGIPPVNYGDFTTVPPSLQDPDSPINTIRLVFGGQFLHLHYRAADGITNVHLENHLPYNRWSVCETGPIEETLTFYDGQQPGDTLLIGTDDGRVAVEAASYGLDSLLDYGTNEIQCRARTGSMDFGAPQTLKEVGNIILDASVNGAHIPDADGGGDGVLVQMYYDTETSLGDPLQIDGVGRQKFPLSLRQGGDEKYCYSAAFEFRWNGNATIYQAETLWRMDEELLRHWETPPSSNGMKGWQHLRDLYISLRSTADVNMLVLVDGVVYQPTVPAGVAGVIPSTAGARKKIHLYMPPVKGKMFQYFLNGGPFRLYGEDCEVYVKEFNTGNSYRSVAPFNQAGGGS